VQELIDERAGETIEAPDEGLERGAEIIDADI